MRRRNLFFLTPLILVAPAGLCACSVNGTTLTAASASEGDVSACASLIAAGDTLVIPAGGATWNTTLTITIPTSASSSTITTIQGATTCTGSGDHNLGTSGIVSCIDGTTITGAVSGNPSLVIVPPATGELRVTGLTITANTETYHGIVNFNGTSTNPGIRLDHCHFTGNPYGTGDIEIDGWVYGVIDHNIFFGAEANENEIRVYNGGYWNGETDGLGHASWADSPHFGSNKAIYIEANYFYSNSTGRGGYVNDCGVGGRFVTRFNTTYYQFVPSYTHGTTGSGGAYRGCRMLELYGNNNNWVTAAYYTYMNMESGTAIIWGNTLQHYRSIINEDNSRSAGPSVYLQKAPPAGWGYCGNYLGSQPTDSAWDGNTNSITGYPCMDQPGRGKGDLLEGNFPKVCDETRGCPNYTGTRPNQEMEPVYAWGNSYDSTMTNYWQSSADAKPIMANNRDYYFPCGSKNSSCSSFTGAYGVGSGTLGSRPSTCTSGVGYWATDQGSWNRSGNGFGNGVFYVCSATNTWTSYYTPYTYPHPLAEVRTYPRLPR